MTDDAFETMLGRLKPTEATADPVAAAYAAGRAAGGRAANRRWAGVATVMAIAAVVPWVVHRGRPAAVAVVGAVPLGVARPDRVVVTSPPVVPGNAWQLQALVLAGGMDALPRTRLVARPATPAYGW